MWLSWQDEIQLSSDEVQTTIAGPMGRMIVHAPAPEIRSAMQRLCPPGEDEERLAESILSTAPVEALAQWYYHLDQFRRRGFIQRSLLSDEKPLATYRPFGEPVPLRSRIPYSPVPSKGCYSTNSMQVSGDAGHIAYVLSRFAFVRRLDSVLVLESPLAHGHIILHDARVMFLLSSLAQPCRLQELSDLSNGTGHPIHVDDIKALLRLLRESQMIDTVPRNLSDIPCDASSTDVDSDADSTMATWEFHDLLFHSRSRRGRSDGQFGGTYRLAEIPPPSALKAIAYRESYDLHRPDLAQLERDDPPYAQVQEHRRSRREYASDPLTANQLGEFLYRVARVKELRQFTTPAYAKAKIVETASRPYPAGGGLYELEFYIAIQACQDYSPGLFHYDPLHHRLMRLSLPSDCAKPLIDEAAGSAGISPETVQVLVVLTSRFARIAWKYESIAYALTMKHVGVVYQTMYLAATAMGLAPCALGCGDSDLFSRVAGTDYYVETSVGEFLLGSSVSEVQV